MKSSILLLGALVLCLARIQAQNATPNPAISTPPGGRAVVERRSTNAPVNLGGETLSPEMRDKLRATQEKYREEQKKLMDKLSAARTELNAAVQSETFDEKTVREKATAVGELEADQAVLRAKQYQEMKPFLPKRSAIQHLGTNSVTGQGTPVKKSTVSTNRGNIKSSRPAPAPNK
jgi:Spy/CpxP family protein refolding chaperone